MNNTPILNHNFWDCECDEDYIHSTYEHYCTHCGVHKNNAPDSHHSEVIKYFVRKNSMKLLNEVKRSKQYREYDLNHLYTEYLLTYRLNEVDALKQLRNVIKWRSTFF